jgi:hypothetical protein
MLLRRRVIVVIGAALVAGAPHAALAYRPFDGTDAAVADVGEVEIELQPAGVERSSRQKTLIAPAVVYNYGFIKDLELVLVSQLETPLASSGPSILTDSGIFLKHVLRQGTLQDQAGLSIASEFGVLLPDTLRPGGTGASATLIISQRWDWGTVHLNAETLWTRDQRAGAFTSVIFEGPSKWTVRPVAEFSYEEDFGQTHTAAALVGAIWHVRDNLSFDVAWKHSVRGAAHADEFRAGLTFGFSVSSPNRTESTLTIQRTSMP